MSHKATNWAVSQRGVSPVAKVLLWQLADRHNPDNGCFPDQGTLARDCEISRATVNRILLELERKALIRRVVRHHPVTKKQLPTRYILAFEDEFEIAADAESRVSNCDTASGDENEPDSGESRISFDDEETASRVSNSGRAVSHLRAEPCLTGETHIKGLTSKLTSKRTNTRAPRSDRGSVFQTIWEAFPMRPNSPQMDAWQLFENIDEGDLPAVEAGALRFAQWFREEAARKGDDFEEACRFAPYLVNWLKGQKWLDAANLPISTKLDPANAVDMSGTESVSKWQQMALFEACERLRGRPVPVGKSGSWTFPRDLVDAARALVAGEQANERAAG